MPRNKYAKLKKQIEIKIERISALKKGLCVNNQLRDKNDIECVEDDVAEIFDLLDGSDDEMPQESEMPEQIEIPQRNEIEVTPSPSRNANTDENEDSVEIITENGIGIAATNEITAGIEPIQVDSEFSLQYSYTTDVSYFRYGFNIILNENNYFPDFEQPAICALQY